MSRDKNIDWDYVNSVLEGTESEEVTVDEPDKKRVNPIAIKYIQTHGIGSGENRVPSFVIFSHFRKWCAEKNYYQKIGLTEFFRTFNQCFEQVRTGKQRYYLINDVIGTTPEDIENARRHQKIYQGMRRRQREEKRQRKISRTEERAKLEIQDGTH